MALKLEKFLCVHTRTHTFFSISTICKEQCYTNLGMFSVLHAGINLTVAVKLLGETRQLPLVSLHGQTTVEINMQIREVLLPDILFSKTFFYKVPLDGCFSIASQNG